MGLKFLNSVWPLKCHFLLPLKEKCFYNGVAKSQVIKGRFEKRERKNEDHN